MVEHLTPSPGIDGSNLSTGGKLANTAFGRPNVSPCHSVNSETSFFSSCMFIDQMSVGLMVFVEPRESDGSKNTPSVQFFVSNVQKNFIAYCLDFIGKQCGILSTDETSTVLLSTDETV